jgi:hypothetical protein
MDEAPPPSSSSPSPKSTSQPPTWALPAAFLGGLFSLFIEPFFLLYQGKNSADAFWSHALRSLDWTFILRQSPFLLFILGLVLIFAGYRLRTAFSDREWWPWVRVGVGFLLGVTFSLVLIHELLDIAYFRGAFILAVAAYAFVILALLALLFVWPLPIFTSDGEPIGRLESSGKTLHIVVILFCVWLLMPAIPAMLGVAAAPPSAPAEGYGSSPGPYLVNTQTYVYPMPDEVEAIIGDVEGDIEFSIYLTLPEIPADERMETMPLAIILHGFGSPYWETYVDWATHLSAKGMAVAFIQYPSDVHPIGVDTFDLIEAQGMSNHPQHIPRSAAIAAAIEHLNETALVGNRSAWIDSVIGNTSIDPSNLWVGGHSLGAGLTFRTLDESLARGWGDGSLFIALEAPYAHSVDAELRGDMSRLPANTLVHIAISEDDTSVSPCYGVWHQQRIISRDGAGDLGDGQVILMTIPSDRHGFPPMVASHYLQASQVHEVLADWGFYRRADAQADYMVARSDGNTSTDISADDYLFNETWLANMGEWSDGVAVEEITVYHDALNEGTEEYQDCRQESTAWN